MDDLFVYTGYDRTKSTIDESVQWVKFSQETQYQIWFKCKSRFCRSGELWRDLNLEGTVRKDTVEFTLSHETTEENGGIKSFFTSLKGLFVCKIDQESFSRLEYLHTT